MSDNPKRASVLVRAVTQSPMNALRWCLTLDCGHDVWVTSKRSPASRDAALSEVKP